MYGVTDDGHSCMAHIHQFLSYLYVECLENKEFSKQELDSIKAAFNHKLGEYQGVVQIEQVEKASVIPYSEGLKKFLKVYVFVPSSIKKCRDLVENG